MSKQKYVIIFCFLWIIWGCDLNDDSRKYDGESKLSKIMALQGSYTAAADEDAISLETERLASAVPVAELLGTAALRDIGLQDSELSLRADDSTGTLALTICPDGIEPKTIQITGFLLPAPVPPPDLNSVSSSPEAARSVADLLREREQAKPLDAQLMNLDLGKRASEISVADLPPVLTDNLPIRRQRLELLPHDSAGKLYLVFFAQDIPAEYEDEISPVAEIYVVSGFKKGPAVKLRFSSPLQNLYQLGDKLPISVSVQNLRENSYLQYKYRKSGIMSAGLPVAVFLGRDLIGTLEFPWDGSAMTKSPEKEIFFVKDVEEDRIYQSSLTLQVPKFIDNSEIKIVTKPRLVKYGPAFYEANFQFGHKMYLQDIAQVLGKTPTSSEEIFAQYYQLCKGYLNKYPGVAPEYIKARMLDEDIQKCQTQIADKDREIKDYERKIRTQTKINKAVGLCFKILVIAELAVGGAMIFATGGAAAPWLIALATVELSWTVDRVTKDGKLTLSEILPIGPTKLVDATFSSPYWDVDTTRPTVKMLGLKPDKTITKLPGTKPPPGSPGLGTYLGSTYGAQKKTAAVTSELGTTGSLKPQLATVGIALASAIYNYSAVASSMRLADKYEYLQKQKVLLEHKKQVLQDLRKAPALRDTFIACEEGKHLLKPSLGRQNPANGSFKILREEVEQKLRASSDPLDTALKGRLYNIIPCRRNGKKEFIYQTIKYQRKKSGAQINNYAGHFYRLDKRTGDIVYRTSKEIVDNVSDMYGDNYPGMEHPTSDEESAKIVRYTNELLEHQL